MGIISESYDADKVYIKVADVLNRDIKIKRLNLALVDGSQWDAVQGKFVPTGKKVEKFFLDFDDLDLDGKESTIYGDYKHVISVIKHVWDKKGKDAFKGRTVRFITAPNKTDPSKTHYTLIDVD